MVPRFWRCAEPCLLTRFNAREFPRGKNLALIFPSSV